MVLVLLLLIETTIFPDPSTSAHGPSRSSILGKVCPEDSVRGVLLLVVVSFRLLSRNALPGFLQSPGLGYLAVAVHRTPSCKSALHGAHTSARNSGVDSLRMLRPRPCSSSPRLASPFQPRSTLSITPKARQIDGSGLFVSGLFLRRRNCAITTRKVIVSSVLAQQDSLLIC